MRLKKLEIYGFKSFAEKVDLQFDQGITGIVGPNGCGKSNISDAVRWVLGEQSARILRGAKMEDVIFNGTEKRRRLSYCEVILTFDNEDHALPIDFTEVAVSRRVYRTGESEYAINRAECRLRDIVELFRDTGIGKEGYSLIGQGRIDEILSVKSEDRRQVFEEAAGIVKYKSRKNEAQRRMENTRLNIARLDDILAELNARLEPLRAQSETAREYLQLRDELKTLELNLFLLRGERYTARIAELKQSIALLAEEIAESTQREGALNEKREALRESVRALEEEAAAAREGVQESIRLVEAREGAIGVRKERIAGARRELDRLTTERDAAREGEAGVARQLTILTDKISQETAQALSMREALHRDEGILGAGEATLNEREEKAEARKSAIIEAMNRLGDVRSEQARLSAMRDSLTSRVSALQSDADRDADERADDQSQREAVRTALREARAEKEALDKQARESDMRVRVLGERTEELNEKLSEWTASYQETASRLRVLEEMQRDYEGYQNSVKNVLQQARRTPNSGVHGVVATLIKAPRELERALDMVLGAALQNVVVDREEDAKRMIEYLRVNRLGRATFLPISAVRGRTLEARERGVLSMRGCVGLASELVEFAPQYRGIVESLLGRTVIAENLDAGIAIMRAGRQAFRLVTLEGDVMHAGGSMSGGSVQSRVTSLLSREREVDESRQKLKQCTLRVREIREELTEMEGQRAELKKERAALYERVHEQDIACAREEAHLAAAEEELRGRTERAQRTEDERGRLAAQLRDVEASLAGLGERQSGEERTSAEMRSEIAEMQKEILRLREEIAEQRARVSDARVALAAIERGLAESARDRDRLTARGGDLEGMLRESEAAIARTEAALKADEEALDGETRLLAGEKNALEAARAAFADRDKRRTAAQEEQSQVQRTLDELRGRLDAATEQSHRGETQLIRLEGEYQALSDRIWEDYELTQEGAEPFRDENIKLSEADKRVSQIRARIKQMGSVNVSAVDEYRQTMERVEEMSGQRDDLVKAELDLQSIVEELQKKMETQFKAQFALLDMYFQQTFVKLFGGGRAELRLNDPKDALNCGIEIVAQPPGKKLQMLSLLSGGERALTAIAILFAMLKLKPTPFCFLDEIEAALDDANIDNFAEYLHDYSSGTQFVVVTHRKGTMERCDALYGVAMEEKGVSRLVSVKLKEAV